MNNIERLYDAVRIRCPGILDSAIEHELFGIIDEICRVTYFYHYVLAIDLVEGQVIYRVDLPALDVIKAYQAGHLTLDTTVCIYDDMRGVMALQAIPVAADLTYPLLVELAVSPRAQTYDPPNPSVAIPIDEWLPSSEFERAYQCMLDGVLSRCMAHPAKPYSNGAIAQYHGRRFQNGMVRLKAAPRDPASPSWKFPAFM